MPEGKACNFNALRGKAVFQFQEQGPGPRRIDLVLDGNMRSPASLILWRQKRGKMLCNHGADIDQFRAFNPIGNAPAKVDQAADLRFWGWCPCQITQQPCNFCLGRGRQMMKQGQMRAQIVAFRREMTLSQTIQPSEVRIAQQGRDNERRVQIST